MSSIRRFSLLLSPLLGLGASLLTDSNAWSLPSDRNQPIHVQADSLEANDKSRVAVYRGDVVITQGSMVVKGDKVTITQSQDGDVETFTSVGRPAYYEQQPNAGDPPVKAWGLTIQYLAKKQRLILLDQARLEQRGDSFRGEKVVYDIERHIVNGGRAGNASVTTPSPRIDMIIQPSKSKPQKQQ